MRRKRNKGEGRKTEDEGKEDRVKQEETWKGEERETEKETIKEEESIGEGKKVRIRIWEGRKRGRVCYNRRVNEGEGVGKGRRGGC